MLLTSSLATTVTNTEIGRAGGGEVEGQRRIQLKSHEPLLPIPLSLPQISSPFYLTKFKGDAVKYLSLEVWVCCVRMIGYTEEAVREWVDEAACPSEWWMA